jgi:4-hydroxy-2,2'-bipyrrole-5-carbaldehyde O-methyltransferase
MNIRTLASLAANGHLTALLSMTRAIRPYHRLVFVAAGLSSGALAKLAAGPVPVNTLAAELAIGSAMCEGLEAWLQLGVALGELRSGPEGYSLRGRLSRKLVDPTNDAAAAFIEEAATLHSLFITQALRRLREGSRFTLADQDGRLVARSSRLAEPFICEAVDHVIPVRGPVSLFEIGCGAGAHIRYAAERNPELTALGIELQSDAAALAAENVSRWNLATRVTIEVADITDRAPPPLFDLATLHQNIYYFPVDRRVAVLRHVRSFLKPGGRLLLTTLCQGRGVPVAILNLWGVMTEGCGRLPVPAEMAAQLEEAGFVDIRRRSLIPGESFYSFIGTNPHAA